LVEERVERSLAERLVRKALVSVLPHPRRFAALTAIGRLARPFLPRALAAKVPTARPAGTWPRAQGRRRALALAGCVQSVATPLTNAAAARVLDRLGVDLVTVPEAGCCGAVAYHLNAQAEGLDAARRNIDAWWPEIESGCEAILVTASGCGVMVKDYGALLADDPGYAERATRVSALARDPAEYLAGLDLDGLGRPGTGRRIAFHPPCTLQHGQQLPGVTEGLLGRLGFTLTPVNDVHLCCGSAGTYSLTQPGLSLRLRDNKVAALEAGGPELIATANIGCQLHLEAGSGLAVVHWLELIDPLSSASPRAYS
jgi:glycolate oxidase iron-sulfur subunit